MSDDECTCVQVTDDGITDMTGCPVHGDERQVKRPPRDRQKRKPGHDRQIRHPRRER